MDPQASGDLDATITQTWQYPVKSMQGIRTDSLRVERHGVVGDRNWALFDLDAERVLSAKRVGKLFEAIVDQGSMVLPTGVTLSLDDAANGAVCEEISDWLDRPVRVCSVDDIEELGDGHLTYQMTFDPPNDDSEYYDIPMPEGSFVDLAPLHLVSTATLDGCRSARPDLDWDVRRFRPNLLVEIDAEAFVESSWIGRPIRIGEELIIEVSQATVRCAMPLRPQPALGAEQPELEREPDLFRAMNELNPLMPNHLGVYANVLEPGEVRVGDQLRFV